MAGKLLAKLGNCQNVVNFGIETVPDTGQNPEKVKAHKLEAESLAGSVAAVLG